MMKILWSFLPCLSDGVGCFTVYSELEGTLYYVFSRFGKRNGDDHAFQVFFVMKALKMKLLLKYE